MDWTEYEISLLRVLKSYEDYFHFTLEEMKSFVFPFKAIEVTENPFFRSKNIALKPKDTLREINRLFDIEAKKYM